MAERYKEIEPVSAQLFVEFGYIAARLGKVPVPKGPRKSGQGQDLVELLGAAAREPNWISQVSKR
jgi:hypothetical protein